MNMRRSISGFEWEREYDRRWPSPVPEDAASRLCQRALEIGDRLEGETWLSSILGEWWRESEGKWWWDGPEEELRDLYFLTAGPVIREVAAVGGAGAWTILHGLARLDTGRVAGLAGDLADTLDVPELDPPYWTTYLAEWTPVRERSQRRPNGNEVLAIELRHVLDEPQWLAVFTSAWGGTIRLERYGGFDEVEEFAVAVARKNAKVLPFEELVAGQGCQRAHKALRKGHGDHRHQDRFVELRAWALAMTTPRMTDRDRRLRRARLDRWDIDENAWDNRSF
jgi:hypothetical protein